MPAHHPNTFQTPSAVIFDMDGVLHAHGDPVPGAADLLRRLKSLRVPHCVLTNEDRWTNAELSLKLQSVLGVEVHADDIYSASNSVRDFLLRVKGADKVLSVFVVGEHGLKDCVGEVCELATLVTPASAVDYVVLGARFIDPNQRFKGWKVPPSGTPDTRFPSPDSRFIEAAETEHALACVAAGAKMLFTCPDTFEVDGEGRLRLGMPGGTVDLISSITGANGFNCGKPNAAMARKAESIIRRQRMIAQSHDQSLEPSSILFVGDSLDTDIRIATENGYAAALVVNSEISRRKLNKSCFRPDFILEGGLQGLMGLWLSEDS